MNREVIDVKTCALVNSVLILGQDRRLFFKEGKLQKILYFVYGFYKVDNDYDLLTERFAPHPFGPCLESVASAYKGYSGVIINEVTFKGTVHRFSDLHAPEIYNTINKVFAKYGKSSDEDLSHITHRKNGAWMKAREKGGMYIDQNDIIEEFKSLTGYEKQTSL